MLFSLQKQEVSFFPFSLCCGSGRFSALSLRIRTRLCCAAKPIQPSLIIFRYCISKQSSLCFLFFFSAPAVRESIVDENKHESCGLTETHNGASFEQLRENQKKKKIFFFSAEEVLRSFPSGTDILAQELDMSCGIVPACAAPCTACAAAERKSESSK